MTAITVTDLNNAKADVDHIAAIANSPSLTATDRLGHTKKTVAGWQDQVDSALTDAESEIVAAKNEAFAARDAINNRIYPSTYDPASPPTTNPSGGPVIDGNEFSGTDGFRYARIAGVWVNQTAAAAASALGANGSASAASASAGDALASKNAAVIAQAAAEVARDAALAAQRIFASTAAGITGTSTGQYFYVVSATSTLTLELWWNNAGVATDTGKRMPSSTLLTDAVLLANAGLGDVYALGTLASYGSTAGNTTTYPGSFTDTFFPQLASAQRGYLQDFSVRAAATGTGQVIVLVPDQNSQYGYSVKAVVAVAVAAGVNTFQGSAIYTNALPAGSRVGYRYLSGGHVRYQAGGPVKRIQTNAQTVGQALSGSMVDYAQDVAVAFNVRPATTTSLDERVAAIEAGTNARNLKLTAAIGQAPAAPNVTYGNAALAVSGNLAAGTWVYGLPVSTAPAVLDSVSIPCANPFSDPDGTLYSSQLAVASTDATGTIVVSAVWTIYLAPGKTNVITGFGETVLPAGSYVLVTQTNARAPISYKAGTTDGGGVFLNAAGALTVSQTLALGAYSNTPIVSYTVRQAASAINTRLSALETAQANFTSAARATTLAGQRFAGTSFPAGWTNTGSWTCNDGLVSPAAGGWGVWAALSGDCSVGNREFMALLQVNAANAVFGICAKPPEATINGAVAMVDGSAGKLRLYSWDGSTTPGSFDTEVALPAALVVGRLYSLEVVKKGLATTITFTDRVTQQSCTLTETQKAANRQWHGKAGMMYVSGSGSAGDIKVDSFDMIGLHRQDPRAIVIGDSICEGVNLPANSPTWAYQLATRRSTDNDILIAARAGDETPNTLLRVGYDITPWSPKYVVLAIGTNDISQATWRTNIASLIASAVARGAEPILVTQAPRADGTQALRTAMNADIRSMFFGRYRYIDMALAVSASNDGVTWNAAYNSGDNVHPNYAGQVKMYQQALADAPFLVR